MKPQRKNQVVWMVKNEHGNLCYWLAGGMRKQTIELFRQERFDVCEREKLWTWKDYRKIGCRVVKVQLKELT